MQKGLDEDLFYKLKQYNILILSIVTFLVTLVLILIELDRQNYQVKKKEIIVNYWDEFFPLDQEELTLRSRLILEARSPEEKEKAKAALLKSVRKILDADNSIYRVALENTEHQTLLKEERSKFRQYNTFSNSLFLKGFSGQTSLKITDPVKNVPMGRLIVGYTTPKDDPRIQALTSEYRIYALIVIVFLSIVYYFILRILILPVKRVVGRLDEARRRPPLLFEHPNTLLEKEYNNIARDSLLTRVSQKMKDFLATSTNLDGARILSDLPAFISNLFGLDMVCFLSLSRKGENEFEVRGEYSQDSVDDPGLLKGLVELILSQSATPAIPLIEKNIKYGSQTIKHVARQIFAFTDIVMADKDYKDILVCAFIPDVNRSSPPEKWHLETYRLLADEIRLGLQTIENQRKVIFKEKSEATISLSRNLGHDLTNIIATSKLDLLAVKSFLDMDEEQIKRSPEKQKIFRESLAAVLNNTMFLQQIVNVYRSFSFIKRPRFEYADVNRLLSEIVDLFRLSTSANIDIRTSYAAEIPPCRLEERLVKLAVFNILTNALDAIRRKSGPEAVSGFINVKTLFDEKQDQVVISIRDSGDGIRNEKGELATPHEIERVFNLGFTTKKEEEGEGLGLNWVYTIITEFHKGRIQPRNHPEGGAEFLIYLNREIPEEEPVH